MNLHEYQAKELLASYGLPVQGGILAHNGEEAAAAYDKLGGKFAVVKAQVHAGGRGKAGGVKVVKSREEAKEVAESLIGTNLVTYQTDANGQPANFLDVGGGATKDRVVEAFKLILEDKSVKGVLINIFGGIVRCDMIAEAIVAAVKEINVDVPVVVRLEGNNAELGAKILNESGLKLTSADGLNDAAEKIVAAVNA